MRVEFSKEFEKAARKLSGKMLESVRIAVQEVINAQSIEELTDCKKLVDYDFIVFSPCKYPRHCLARSRSARTNRLSSPVPY